MSRTPASDRLRRILAMVPWILAHPDGAPVAEVCSRFGLTRDQLVAELEQLMMVGVYPYTPEQYIDWSIEGDRVTIILADWFRRPLRLTPEQGLALVATGQSLTALYGADPDGPLARGIAKVAAVLGVDPDTVDVQLGPAAASTLELLQQAISERHPVEMDYYTYGRDERTHRVVDPYRLYADQGQWYLEGFCHTSDDERIFRVDRIEHVVVRDETFAPPADAASLGLFRAAADAPRVTLDLDADATWVAEQYPVERREALDDGRTRVTLAVTAAPWLERLLLRLGPSASVVDAPAALAGVGPAAARRVLARYRATTPAPGASPNP